MRIVERVDRESDGRSVWARVTFERHCRIATKYVRVYKPQLPDAQWLPHALRKAAVEADRDIAWRMYPEAGWPAVMEFCEFGRVRNVVLDRIEGIREFFPELEGRA